VNKGAANKNVTFRDYKHLILSDLYRISGAVTLSSLFRQVLGDGTYQYIFWMRTCLYASENRLLRRALYPVARLMLRRYRYKYGIAIPFTTSIGSGFYIGHFGSIIVHRKTVIGRNCNLSHGVTLGQANRGKNKGHATIGDNTYIGPGAKVIGAVSIGDNVAVGANCVVTKDVPNNAVVAGVPAKIISYKGSVDYIGNTDYEGKIP
jgi:serine O-acetyltransferase